MAEMDVVLGPLRAMYPSLGQDDIERSLARVQRIVKAAQAACVSTNGQPASVSDWRAKVVADFTAERGAPLFLPSSPASGFSARHRGRVRPRVR